MQLVAPTDRSKHRAFLIGEGQSEVGPRLGGHAPDLEQTLSLHPAAQYVLTFPFAEAPAIFVSVFTNASFPELLSTINQKLRSDERILVVRHGPLPRSRRNDFLSGLSAHPLIVQGHLAEDTVPDGEGGQLISSAHKFGGRAYCIQEPELEGAEALLDSGYVQALQLDFPGSADATVSGDWPFADGIFNLFMHPDESHPVYWAVQK